MPAIPGFHGVEGFCHLPCLVFRIRVTDFCFSHLIGNIYTTVYHLLHARTRTVKWCPMIFKGHRITFTSLVTGSPVPVQVGSIFTKQSNHSLHVVVPARRVFRRIINIGRIGRFCRCVLITARCHRKGQPHCQGYRIKEILFHIHNSFRN